MRPRRKACRDAIALLVRICLVERYCNEAMHFTETAECKFRLVVNVEGCKKKVDKVRMNRDIVFSGICEIM